DGPPRPRTYTLSLHDALPISLTPREHESSSCSRGCRLMADSDSPWPHGIHRAAAFRAARRPQMTPATSPTPCAVLATGTPSAPRSEEHTSELQSREKLVCRLL